MRRSTARALAAVATVVLLGAMVGTAAANRIEVRPWERGFRIALTQWHIAMAFGETRFAVECPVTLEGSFHSRTFAKVARALVGHITRATVVEASCRGFTGQNEEGEWPAKLRFLTETLPWHVTYRSFTGTLPTMASVKVDVIGPAIRIYELPFGATCLYRATTEVPMDYSFELSATGVVLGFRGNEAGRMPLSEGHLLCSAEGLAYPGVGMVRQLGSTATIALRLI